MTLRALVGMVALLYSSRKMTKQQILRNKRPRNKNRSEFSSHRVLILYSYIRYALFLSFVKMKKKTQITCNKI